MGSRLRRIRRCGRVGSSRWDTGRGRYVGRGRGATGRHVRCGRRIHRRGRRRSIRRGHGRRHNHARVRERPRLRGPMRGNHRYSPLRLLRERLRLFAQRGRRGADLCGRSLRLSVPANVRGLRRNQERVSGRSVTAHAVRRLRGCLPGQQTAVRAHRRRRLCVRCGLSRRRARFCAVRRAPTPPATRATAAPVGAPARPPSPTRCPRAVADCAATPARPPTPRATGPASTLRATPITAAAAVRRSRARRPGGAAPRPASALRPAAGPVSTPTPTGRTAAPVVTTAWAASARAARASR